MLTVSPFRFLRLRSFVVDYRFLKNWPATSMKNVIAPKLECWRETSTVASSQGQMDNEKQKLFQSLVCSKFEKSIHTFFVWWTISIFQHLLGDQRNWVAKRVIALPRESYNLESRSTFTRFRRAELITKLYLVAPFETTKSTLFSPCFLVLLNFPSNSLKYLCLQLMRAPKINYSALHLVISLIPWRLMFFKIFINVVDAYP